jgi:hypothetical protein
MSVLVTSIARVKDWQALEQLNNETLVGRVKKIRVRCYRVYRNVNDASQALIIVELPDHDAVREVSEALTEQINMLFEGGISTDGIWELTELEGIG